VRMISQGASEINMSFMIDEDDVDEAVRSLHAAFFVDPDPEIFDVSARNEAAAIGTALDGSKTKVESVHL
jgi:aspartate kinase